MLEQRARIARVRKIIQLRAQRLAWSKDIRLRQRRRLGARLRKQVAAEQRARALLEQIAALPSVRHMRRIEPSHLMLSEQERVAVGHLARRTIGKIADRGQSRDSPA